MRSVLPLAALLVLSACDSGTAVEEVPQYFQAQFLLDAMPSLEGGAAYQSWARVSGSWQAVSRFNYDEQGRLIDESGRLIANTFTTDFDLQPSTEILITVEGRRDADLEPSATRILQGDMVGSGATLTFAAALTDLTGVITNYTIGTPTDNDPSNESFGFWLGTPGTYAPAMTAPTLGAGWVYELWADLASGRASLGRFSNPTGSDEASPFSNQPETFAVPGESFVENPPVGVTFPLHVGGLGVFITVEPDPETTAGTPFGIRIQEATIPASVTGGEALSMTAVSAFPSGTVQFR
ncbi:MAG: hypothetical protein ACI9W4_002266 [Rhodothermales bacterium]|jgi:hypothetical protein